MFDTQTGRQTTTPLRTQERASERTNVRTTAKTAVTKISPVSWLEAHVPVSPKDLGRTGRPVASVSVSCRSKALAPTRAVCSVGPQSARFVAAPSGPTSTYIVGWLALRLPDVPTRNRLFDDLKELQIWLAAGLSDSPLRFPSDVGRLDKFPADAGDCDLLLLPLLPLAFKLDFFRKTFAR